ncbi:anti-sigma factor family protein [Maledivibacter halophilus]|uniref:Anti-sigma-W factor RsiW n=1 Tax=Maledivibacter halophilus TaxID=36842 RepID=A0A1T5MLB9_9FIRM|nr:zf-HC2 domain-containing protein [Maledivibacter halophilus]SKC89011.1 Putative zinc-finger [Maledivibacter halophilus]
MECKEILEKLDMYLENRLNDIEKYRIEKHLEVCSKCSKEYKELKGVFDLLSSHPVVLPPEDFTEKVMNQIKIKSKANNIRTIIIKKWGISFVAAGLLIFVLNTSFGYSTEDISSYIYEKPLSINSQITNCLKEIPSVVSRTYKKLDFKQIKFFKNK